MRCENCGTVIEDGTSHEWRTAGICEVVTLDLTPEDEDGFLPPTEWDPASDD